jgi:hypothetical protein
MKTDGRIECWPGNGARRCGLRYRDMEHVDLDAARKMVSAWLDEHPNGTLPQMAGELKRNYPDFPDFPAEMTVVLRGMMTAELRRRTSPPEGPAARGDGPGGQGRTPGPSRELTPSRP